MLTNGTPFLHLAVKEFLRDLISLRTGPSLKHSFQLLKNLKGPGEIFKTILKVRFHSKQHGALNHTIIIFARLINSFLISRSIYSRGVTKRFLKDIVLLSARENDSQIAEPVGEVRPIVFKLFFLSKNVEVEVGLSHVIYNICKYKLDYVHDN